jgi:hypothetical protein
MSETTFQCILVSAAIKDCSIVVSFQSCEGDVQRLHHAFCSYGGLRMTALRWGRNDNRAMLRRTLLLPASCASCMRLF